jgi:Cu2+-exporting ATPase
VRFDKTGTITRGRLLPIGALPLDDREKQAALGLARVSRHPLSRALAVALEAEHVTAAALDELREYPGLGIEGRLGGARVALGQPNWLGAQANEGAALQVAFLIGGGAPKLLTFADEIRVDAAATIRRLEGMGLESVILSGDRRDAVAPIAEALGTTALVELMPADKVAAITRLQHAGRHVLMVGDGLNDGPALAAGHVSMAPASAADVGQSAADALFLGDGLMPVATAVAAARCTRAIVRQNFALAIGYNLLAVPLAIAGLVTPLIAAAAMSSSSLLVLANALRLRGCAR